MTHLADESATTLPAELDVDLAVVGFGKGGKTLAATMARRGARVAMIEQSARMYGGTCINIGCVPTKALVHDAENGSTDLPGPDRYRRAAERTDALTTLLRGKNFAMLDTLDTVTVITGAATFAAPRRLLVTAGDDTLRVTARTIVINTGADPELPPLPGLRESEHVVTSTQLLARTERPDELVVLGGGYDPDRHHRHRHRGRRRRRGRHLYRPGRGPADGPGRHDPRGAGPPSAHRRPRPRRRRDQDRPARRRRRRRPPAHHPAARLRGRRRQRRPPAHVCLARRLPHRARPPDRCPGRGSSTTRAVS